MKLFTRTQEERVLSHADGSCVNGDRCVSPTVDPGTAAVNGKCILCCRYETTKRFDDHGATSTNAVLNVYSNCSGDYDTSAYLDQTEPNKFNGIFGPFIRYNKKDYKASNKRRTGVIQNIPRAPSGDINWIDANFDMDRCLNIDIIDREDWHITFCAKKGCKQDIFTLIDQQRAMGVDGTVVDVDSDDLQCAGCRTSVSTIQSNPLSGVIAYKKKLYARCIFCKNVVLFNKENCPQTCESCIKDFQKKAEDALSVCYYCRRPINVDGRNGSETYTIENDQHIFLCRNHKIRGQNGQKTFTLKQIKELLM